MEDSMKTLYTTTVTVTGGREGNASSNDKQLSLQLALPKELGGSGKSGATNPEQLFAAGYAACFESAIRHIARGRKIKIDSSQVDGQVELRGKEDGAFSLAVSLDVRLPGLDRDTAELLVGEAHRICPYSNATRGNIPVKVALQ